MPVVFRALVACLLLVPVGPALPAEPTDVVGTGAADPVDALATLGYQPLTVVSGSLRLAGSTTLQQAAALWASGFGAVHPEVEVAIDSAGTDAGWKALCAATADIALLSRPLADSDREAFAGAVGAAARSLAVVPVGFEKLVWIVHAANPAVELPWSPATGVIAATDGAAGGVVTWNRLGVAGDQAVVPVRVHATEVGSGTRWHLDRLLTGTAATTIDVREHPTIKDLAAAVAADRGGLGLIGDNDGLWPGVRMLPLAIPTDVAPVADAVPGSARTPDCRPLFVAVAIPRQGEWPALLREFVSYILSWHGQLDVAQDGLLPLTRAEVLAQREILGSPVER